MDSRACLGITGEVICWRSNYTFLLKIRESCILVLWMSLVKNILTER